MRQFSLFLLIEKIKINKVFNGIIFGFRKIPLLGKFLGDKYYFYGFKEILNTFIPIFSIIWQIIKSFLSFLFAIGISSVYLDFLYKISGQSPLFFSKNYTGSLADVMLTCLPFLFYITNMLTASALTENANKFTELFKDFNFYPKDLAFIYLYLDPFLVFIGRSLGFVILGKYFANINPIFTLLLSLGIYFSRINISYFWTRIYEKKGRLIFDGREILEIIFLILISFIVSLLALIINLDIKLLSLGYFFINLIILPLSIRYFEKFRGYGEIIENTINKYSESVKKLDEDSENIVKIDDKSIKKSNKVRGRGFEYLNNLFFIRHRKHLLKPVLIKSGIFSLVGIISFVLLGFFPMNSKGLYSLLVFIIPIISYILFKQDKILIAFYKNCDNSLLYYGFYREDRKLLRMFWLRFKSIFKLNLTGLIPMIFFYILISTRYMELSLLYFFLPIFYIILNGVFFTILPLFQYYILQPFDKEGVQRSPALTIMNILIYYIFIFFIPSFVDKLGDLNFIILFSILIIGLVLVESLLIYKLSPKTFKIKHWKSPLWGPF